MSGYARLLGPTDGIDGNADEAVRSLIERFVEDVRDAGEHGVTNMLSGDRDPDERVWGISLQPAVQGEELDRPDFEVVASLDTFRRMIDGSYAPVDAFRDGKLRISGAISPRVTRRLFAR